MDPLFVPAGGCGQGSYYTTTNVLYVSDSILGQSGYRISDSSTHRPTVARHVGRTFVRSSGTRDRAVKGGSEVSRRPSVTQAGMKTGDRMDSCTASALSWPPGGQFHFESPHCAVGAVFC
ncbi:hypothetical protein LIA77_00356 [Sarocladium implicatum]|nr:hypothetical protein LIA77_00356 [Sarocladium implicatum]